MTPLSPLPSSYRVRFIRGSIHVQNVNAPNLPFEEDLLFIPLVKFHKRYRVPTMTFELHHFDQINTPVNIRREFIAACVGWFHGGLILDLDEKRKREVEYLPMWIIEDMKNNPRILDTYGEVRSQLNQCAKQCAVAIKEHPSGTHL